MIKQLDSKYTLSNVLEVLNIELTEMCFNYKNTQTGFDKSLFSLHNNNENERKHKLINLCLTIFN